MDCFAAEQVEQQADASAVEAIDVEECGVRGRDPLPTKRGDRILGVVARHHR